MARDTLLEMPHAEARAALAAGAPAFLFVNPVEFHGPHLSLHNDLLVSHGLARDLHARLRVKQPELPFLSAGDLEVGVAPTHGRGSRHTPFDTACALLREACRALAELGATRVILLTFHGAPLHSLAIEEGVRLLERQGVRAVAPFNAALQTLLELDGARYPEAFAEIPDAQERAAMQRELFLDFHAGFVETSLALHYAPETVSPSHRSLPPCPAVTPSPAFARASALAKRVGAKRLALELELAAWGTGWQHLRPFPGYTGRPHLATAGAGAAFARLLVDAFEAVVEDVFAGRARSPKPIMTWAAAATLGGRLQP